MSDAGAGALAPAAVAALLGAGATVATAESLTAGLVAAALADVPGASAVLRGGVVAYHGGVKEGLLGVDPDLLGRAGSVDADVARQMARGARRACGADLGISTTGVAGPEPHDGKDVGTVFVGYATAGEDGALELALSGDRARIRAQARDAALRVAAEWAAAAARRDA